MPEAAGVRQGGKLGKGQRPGNCSGSAVSRIVAEKLLPVRKPSLTVFGPRPRAFIKYFRLEQMLRALVLDGIVGLAI